MLMSFLPAAGVRILKKRHEMDTEEQAHRLKRRCAARERLPAAPSQESIIMRATMFPRRTLLTLALGLSLNSAFLAVASNEKLDLPSLQKEVLQTIDRVRPAAVHITGRGSGFSGVIVSPQGHVLSAGHAVTPGASYRITLPDGRRIRGVGKGANSRVDCALIKISNPGANLPYAPMGDSSSLERNQPCIGLSYPGGQRAGVEPVARFGRVVRSVTRNGMLQSSVLMEPGDSGGPLFDLNGHVIGIHSRIGRSMNRNYEVPINVYRDFWNELNRESRFVESGPPRPILGVRCSIARSSKDRRTIEGLKIDMVGEETLASKIGIQTGDVLLQVYGSALKSKRDLRKALVAARDQGAETIQVDLMRADEAIKLAADFDIEREGAPEVPLPEEDYPTATKPPEFTEAVSLTQHLAELEAELDDACVEIISEFGNTGSRSIVGTRIRGTEWVVSKSSAVGQIPTILVDGESLPLSVLYRDPAVDLVLLKAPSVQEHGIEFGAGALEHSVGAFLLSPSHDSGGVVSIVGSPAFRSQQRYSRGYLGVVPKTYQKNKGALLSEVTRDGAAERAGLHAGDIITKLNDTIIRSQRDMRAFLFKVDPNSTISATLRRDDDELTKSITLDAPPEYSDHAADQMPKSSRRDGFREVFTHDADLKPDDCGGPLFDLDGSFVGLNIARNSRVRSYALPAEALCNFVEQASSKTSN